MRWHVRYFRRARAAPQPGARALAPDADQPMHTLRKRLKHPVLPSWALRRCRARVMCFALTYALLSPFRAPRLQVTRSAPHRWSGRG